MGSDVAPGRLVLAGTPLGRPSDASPGLAAALADADVIAAEDTRRLRRLAAELGVTPRGRVVSYYDAVERTRIPGLLQAIRDGETVVLVTDAGMPSVSDPGYRLVAAAAEEGLPVTSVPGPSAVLTALALSGLPSDRFCFEGFLPRRAGERARALAGLAAEPRTMVFFESVHRLGETLAAMVTAFGAGRPAALCRELTKTYEEVRRGTIGEIASGAADVRGEVTLVVAGAAGGAAGNSAASAVAPAAVTPAAPSEEGLAAEVQHLVDGGSSRRDAVDQVAARHGMARRIVYAAATARR